MELKLGAAIKRLRIEKGITQEELSQKMGVSFQAVSKWETNVTTPDIVLLPQLAIFFGVSIDNLFSLNTDDFLARIDSMIRDDHTIHNEDFIWAERYLKGLLSENNSNNEARKRLIGLYQKRANMDSLAQGRYAEEGILIEPMNVALNDTLVRIREERKEPDRLITFYEPLAKKYPENYVIIERLIESYIKNRYFDKAREIMNVSEPRSTYELFSGDIELSLGDEKAAVAIWESATRKYEDDGWMLYQIAERYNKIGMYDSAISCYEKSYTVTPEPKWMDSLYSRAFLFEKLGRTKEAIHMWEIIIKSYEVDYNVKGGEALDWPRLELEKLKAKL